MKKVLSSFLLTLAYSTRALPASPNVPNKTPNDFIYPDSDFFSKHYREHFLEKDEFSGKDEMNGIPYNDYVQNFDKLQLITVRYREDNNELRMVYGNDLAIKGLRNPNHQFETGATIYKLAYPSIADPAFISSKTPGHGYIRYQAMKYDPKKYPTGWGYAIFGYDGKTFPGNPQTAMEACIACHDLAKDRNYVFSVMMENPNPRKVVKEDAEIFRKTFSTPSISIKEFENKKIDLPQTENINFERIDSTLVPEKIRFFIKQKTKKINKLSGKILDNPFPPMLPEIIPLLSKQTLISGLPSVGIVNRNRTSFVFTFIEKNNECTKKQMNIYYGVGYYRSSGAASLLLNQICMDPHNINAGTKSN